MSQEKNGSNSRVLLDNGHVRVVELYLRPGDVEPRHQHPYNFLVYVLSPARLRLTEFPACVSNIVDLQAGEVHWKGPVEHAAENIGDSVLHEIMVEIKP